MPESETDRKDPTVTATLENPTPALDAERADLLVELDVARAALRRCAEGLSDAQLGERPTAGALCLGGLVKHVASTEDEWVRFLQDDPTAMEFVLPDGVTWADLFSGTATTRPQWSIDRERDFAMLPEDTGEAILARYDAVAARTREVVAALGDLSVTRPLPDAPWHEPGAVRSARRVLIHLVAETVQHAGHADILRETIDGRTATG